MAGRKAEPGIPYYPCLSDHTEHEKIRSLVAEFDSHGYWVYKCLLDRIYKRKGYYMEFTDKSLMEQFAKDVCKKQVSLVDEIIAGCIRRSLFDMGVSDSFGVLTSDRIQENYLWATKDRRAKGTMLTFYAEYLLVNIEGEKNIIVRPKNGIYHPNNPISPPNNELIQPIEEKSREKKSKEDEGATATREEIFKKNLIADRIYLESECIKNRIDEEKYLLAVEDFFRDKKNNLEDTKWINESDCRKNFMFWLPKYLGAKAIGKPFQPKAPDSTVYIPPTPALIEDKEPLFDPEKENIAYSNMVDADTEKFMANQKFKPILCAKKLDWLIKKSKVVFSQDEKDNFYQEAQVLFIAETMKHMELIPNRSLMDYYRANKSFRSEEQDKIKVIAKELAYMNFLKQTIPQTATV